MLLGLGCGGGGNPITPPPPPPPSPVATVSITPDAGSLLVGATLQLTATVRDAAGNALTGRSVAWSGDNPAVASVSGTGLLTAISAGGPVRVTATSETISGVATITVGLSSSGTIGPQGGTVATTVVGTTVSFSPGAVSGALPVQVNDTVPVDPTYPVQSNGAIRMVLPVNGNGGSFQQGGSVVISFPVSAAQVPGSTNYVRAKFKGVSGYFWAAVLPAAGGRVTLTIPSGGFLDFKTGFGLDTLDAVLEVEAVDAPEAAPLGTPASTGFRAPTALSRLVENCPIPPSGVPSDFFAPCSSGRLRLTRPGGSGAGSQIGVVLVHGWSPNIADWRSYYLAQGIRCGLIWPFLSTCSIDPMLRLSASLPGQVYFADLLPKLQEDARFSSSPVYIFDYQSYRDFHDSGAELVAALNSEARRSGGVKQFVLVGHSMGGLVSREAAIDIELQPLGNAQTILGIISLGTPHLGTPLSGLWDANGLAGVAGGGAIGILGTFKPAIRSAGAQSLTSRLDRGERTPLYAFGGRFSGFPSLEYLLTSGTLCLVSSAACASDGVVPTYSSRPQEFGALGAVLHDELTGFDHTDLKTGKSQLYGLLASGLQQLIERAGAVSLAFVQQPTSTPSLQSISPSVTVELRDGTGQRLLSSTHQVTIALLGNSNGANLSGSKTAAAVDGRATFSGLSIDLVGTGYMLRATAVGLSATSSTFIITTPIPGTIVATPSSSSFSAVTGAALPAAQLLSITTGGGSLTGLSVGTVTYTGTPGWLATPTLSSSTTPSTLTLRPNTTSLAAGTYSATVPLSAVGAASTTVSVTYTVSATPLPGTPTLIAPTNGATGVSTSTAFSWSAVTGATRYWLNVATTPGTLPADVNVHVCAGCVISDTTLTTGHTLPAPFPRGTPSTTLNPGTQYYWTVQALTPTIPGLYAGGPYSVVGSFTTAVAAGPSITVDSTIVQYAHTQGNSPPTARVISISNGGTGLLNGLSIGSVTYAPGQPTGWFNPALTGTTAPTLLFLTVNPSSLPVGNYSATVQLSSTAPGLTGGPRTITVGLVVSAAPVTFVSLTAGSRHTCGLTASGAAYCWGVGNPLGGLGDGTATDRTTPVLVSGGLTFISLTGGGYHTCGLTSVGAAYCWGDDRWGQLGDGKPADRQFTPVPVSGGLAFAQLSGGSGHTCGVTTVGTGYCWGSSGALGGSVLGDGTTQERHTPTPVAGGLVFATIEARVFHSCGRTSVGAVYCWGWNNNGQLGDGTTTPRIAPVLTIGGVAFAKVQLDQYSTWGLTQAGATYCWGAYCIYPGNGVVTTPSSVAGAPALTSLAAGWNFVCGLAATGTAYCSGENGVGQLGDGTTISRGTFAPVAGGLVFTRLTGGEGHTCGITVGGVAYCWGYNSDGQLGDGTNISRSLPTRVSTP